MNRLSALLSFVFRNFGPLIVYYVAYHYGGAKIAIALSCAWTAGEIAWNRLKGRRTTTFFKFSAAITLAFGAVDLYLKQSFLFRYEAAATNVLVGLYFASTLMAPKSLIQEFAEAQGRLEGLEVTPDREYFFRFLTLVWTAYFFIKAGFYAWVAQRYTIEEALAVRGLVGNASMYGLLFVSIFCARPIKSGLGKLRLLPSTRSTGPAS